MLTANSVSIRIPSSDLFCIIWILLQFWPIRYCLRYVLTHGMAVEPPINSTRLTSFHFFPTECIKEEHS